MGRKLKVGEIVHHKNEDRSDNRIGNLEVMTRAEHSRYHMKKTGGVPVGLRDFCLKSGEGHRFAKLNELSVRGIKRGLRLGLVQKKLAREYGVHRTTIGKIKAGILWGWVEI